MTTIPKKYKHVDIEEKWQSFWDEQGTYHWDETIDRDQTFVVDTPPPTVSGSLHIGHVFSYTHTDVISRYQRMIGKNVFYPMGWDDNGLPTERRVQNVFGINCNPALPYQQEWQPVERQIKRHDYEDVSRQNFINACAVITKQDESAFETLWRRLGLSVDWRQQYATIDDHCRQLSQWSFLDLVEKGHVYQQDAPTMWDVDFQTAVAQAELEDREMTGAYHDIQFNVEGGDVFTISTTRPELLPACIAVVAHPEDSRYQPFFGKYAITPLFHAKVPILPAAHADPEKGTGILMICTFGDINDVEWWKSQNKLPIKQVVGRNGTLRSVQFGEAPFDSEDSMRANQSYASLVGLRIKQARAQIVTLLQDDGALVGDPKPMTHPVKFYEKGDTPIEFIPTRQWFVSILNHKDALLGQGDKIQWNPPHMKSRYQNWVEGLNQDWCISRQRFFGVPFPVWYPLDEQGDPRYHQPIFASLDQLPIDPLSEPPAGYDNSQRNQPNGFIGDPDVMDTWATSSLTPQLMSHWQLNEKRHKSLFPMDIRPQSHEIIRTWAFYTIVKAWFHEQQIPWKNVTISGWILDPDRKKMSKSKGNVVTPTHLLEEYSSDAVRYWAAKARLGADTAFDDGVFAVGKKLSTKLFNASKFVMMQLTDYPVLNDADITQPLDQDFVRRLQGVITQATDAFNQFDYASALDAIEGSFWQFCDHYIELVKVRAYREEDSVKKKSALATLDWSVKTYLRLFAPFMPYITEEIWSWRYSDGTSVHRTQWPVVSEINNMLEKTALFEKAIDVMTEVRGKKSRENTFMKHPVKCLTVNGTESDIQLVKQVEADIVRAGTINEVCYQVSSDWAVDVTLDTVPESAS